MLQLAIVVGLLSQVHAQLSPFLNSHKKDYSCYHSASWITNEKHHQNELLNAYTDVLDSFYTIDMSDAEKIVQAPSAAPVSGPSLRSRPPNAPPMNGSPPPNSQPMGSPPPNSHPMGSPPPGSSRPPNAQPMNGSPPPNSQPMGSPPPNSHPMGSPPPGSSRPPNAQPMNGSPPPNSQPMGSPPPNSHPMGSPPPGSSRPPNAPPMNGSPPPNSQPMGSPPPNSHPMGSPPPGSSPPPNAPPMGSQPPNQMGRSPPPQNNNNGAGNNNNNNNNNHQQPQFTNVTSGWFVYFNGIPNYDHEITQVEIDQLNARPRASTDFVNGHTDVTAGEFVSFGQNIGYNSPACSMGYWPPGPDCAQSYQGENIFTLKPAPELQPNRCYTGNQLGYFVNGIAAFDWSDANSYQSQGIWNNLAMEFERFDVDICLGHAAMGVYHHHSFSPCLAKQLKDEGEGHSPIYGFAYDGYPIFGPYQGKDLLAQSCWQRRDYQSKETGCVDGQRSCVLNDEFDFTKGTKPVSMKGPGLNENLQTMSHNTLLASSGIFYEDYFFNVTCAHQRTPENEFLNEFNGHDHDGIGFHYHVTLDGKTKYPSFPYIVGPKYYGCQPNGMICNQRPGSGHNNNHQQHGPGGNQTFPPLPPSNHSMPPPPPGNGSAPHNMTHHYPPLPSQPMGPPLLSICGVPDASPVSEQQCTSDYFYFSGDSSSSSSSSSSSDSSSKKGLSEGGKTGIAVTVILVIIVAVAFGIARCCGCCCFGKQARRVSFTENQPTHAIPATPEPMSPSVISPSITENGMVQLSEMYKQSQPSPVRAPLYTPAIQSATPAPYPAMVNNNNNRNQSTIATSVVGNSVVAIPVPRSVTADHVIYL